MSKFAATVRIATFAAAVAGASLFGASAQAGSASGTVQLKGTVALNCTVAVADLNQSLNLLDGESSKVVGEVVETCNSGTGYSISLSSANGGQLVGDGAGAAPIGYTVGYDGQSDDLDAPLVVTRSTAQFGKRASLAVSVAGNGQAVAGNYSDTVTITIAAK